MDLRKLKTLIELVETSGIAELEIQEGEERVRITRALPPGQQTVMLQAAPSGVATPAATAGPIVPAEAPPVAASPTKHPGKNPMVGTFYQSAAPGTQPFVEVGDLVEAGDVLWVVGGMK